MLSLKKILLTLSVSSLTYLALLSTGLLRPLEYRFYDFSLKFCRAKPIEDNIIIIGLTEEDISSFGHFPINDRILLDLLNKVFAQSPRVVGFDLHRNVQTGEDDSASNELAQLFRSKSNLIGVEKTTGGNPLEQPILPHPQLADANRTGASEIIEDSDGVVRRGYLYLKRNSLDKEQIPSFPLAVALKYLESDNIAPFSQNSWLRLNHTVFPLLRDNLNFYSLDSLDNYQILLDYCLAQKSFNHFSFSQVLSEDLPEDILRSKIVLVSTMTETIDDSFKTPFDSVPARGFSEITFGVEIHAYFTSALVNSVKHPSLNPPPNFLPIPIESSLLFLFLIGESFWFLAWLHPSNRTFLHLTIFSAIQIFLILASGVLLLQLGFWFPVITCIAIVLTISLISIILLYTTRLTRENSRLEAKVQEKTQQLEKAYQQLEKAYQELESAYPKIALSEKLFAYQRLALMFSHQIKNKTSALGLFRQNCEVNLLQIQQLIEEGDYFLDSDFDTDLSSADPELLALESDLVDPRQLCQDGLEDLAKIDFLIREITSMLHEFNQNTGRENLELTKIDLKQLLQQIAFESCIYKPVDRLTLQEHYDESSPAQIFGIREYLKRAFENIIFNACDSLNLKLKADPHFLPTLQLSTTSVGDSVHIKIRDNGLGIPLENQQKIFDRAWTSKADFGGTGLGLYFAKNLIEEHGGDISVDSSPGVYAQFTLRLPIRKSL